MYVVVGGAGSKILLIRTLSVQDRSVCLPAGWQPPRGVPETWSRHPGTTHHAYRLEKHLKSAASTIAYIGKHAYFHEIAFPATEPR